MEFVLAGADEHVTIPVSGRRIYAAAHGKDLRCPALESFGIQHMTRNFVFREKISGRENLHEKKWPAAQAESGR